jgi:4-aminobutyrate aminotransferase-like enzyme
MATAVETPSVTTTLPGPRSRPLLAAQARQGYAALSDPHGEVPFVMAAKRGSIIEDVDGNTYADHVSGWGATPLGATPERVLDAVSDAHRRYGLEISNYITSPPVVALAERLLELAPPGLTRYAPSMSGTLVVEAGVRFARRATGRPIILGFLGEYHGEGTYMTAAHSTDLSEVPSGSAQFVPGLVFAPYPNRFRMPFHRGAGPFDDTLTLDYVEDWLLVHQVEPDQIAGVLIEPVLTEGGVIVPSAAFWERLEELRRRYGWLLILDEVQTGIGRCGTLFGAELHGLEPDLLLLGKGFAGGGQPIAAVLGREEVLADADGGAGGTFAWVPAACAGALANLELIATGGVLENVAELEAIGKRELGPLVERHEQVGDVRVLGAMVGIEFVTDKASITPAPAFHYAVHQSLVRRGVLGMTQWGKWIYRLHPALNMPPELFAWSCAQVCEAVAEVAAAPPAEFRVVDR